jgi:predicted metal-dependent phosphoesterase TrpH
MAERSALIDLHTHTNHSDGTSSPLHLVVQASELGLEALAIADHDTIGGYQEARAHAQFHGVELVCAAELSTRLTSEGGCPGDRRSAHLLAYFLDAPPSSEFCSWLDSRQESRNRRNFDLIANLQNNGIDISLDEVAACGPIQTGRRHFARVLWEKGYVSSVQEAFDLFLGEEAKTAVAREDIPIEDAVAKIRAAGGLASLAHPVRLQLDENELAWLVGRLADWGMRGIEVYHSEHRPGDSGFYLELSRRFDLIPTGGSDFHGDNKPAVRLGTGINGNVQLPYGFLERMREMFLRTK